MMTSDQKKPERQPLSQAERDQIKFLVGTLARFVFFIIIAAAVMGLLVHTFG